MLNCSILYYSIVMIINIIYVVRIYQYKIFTQINVHAFHTQLTWYTPVLVQYHLCIDLYLTRGCLGWCRVDSLSGLSDRTL